LEAQGDDPGGPRWAEVSRALPGRKGKQCRDRYVNHLAPGINRGDWAAEEEQVLAAGYAVEGTRWAALARRLPGRTENMVRPRL